MNTQGINAYRIGWNIAITRAHEEHMRHGWEEAYDLAIHGEIPIQDFCLETYERLVGEFPSDEETAYDFYHEGAGDGMDQYFMEYDGKLADLHLPILRSDQI